MAIASHKNRIMKNIYSAIAIKQMICREVGYFVFFLLLSGPFSWHQYNPPTDVCMSPVLFADKQGVCDVNGYLRLLTLYRISLWVISCIFAWYPRNMWVVSGISLNFDIIQVVVGKFKLGQSMRFPLNFKIFIAADGLPKQRARASTAMPLISFSRNIPASAPDGLNAAHILWLSWYPPSSTWKNFEHFVH